LFLQKSTDVQFYVQNRFCNSGALFTFGLRCFRKLEAKASMAKELNSAMIVTRVAPADRNWLDREAERQGLSVSTLVRTTIRRQRLASESAEAGEAGKARARGGMA
jgi:hypothetical protein